MSLAYRTATPEDLRFVVGSWTDSYRNAHMAGMIPIPMWREVFPGCIAWVLRRPGCVVTVAYKPGEDVADIYGWAAVETDCPIPSRQRHKGRWVSVETNTPLVHYCFVKQAYRKMGIAKRILKHAGARIDEPFIYSCKTGILSKLPIPQGRWMPLVARYPKTNPEELEHNGSKRSRKDLLRSHDPHDPGGVDPIVDKAEH